MKLELNKIHNGDCLEVLKTFPDNSVDMVLTSPPYDNLRDYKGYTFNFEGIAQQLFRVVKDGGVMVWVVGDATIDGSETGTSFKQALYFKEIGFNLHDTMIYRKDAYPFPPSNRYFPVFEYMFVLAKSIPKTTNLIRVPTNAQDRHNSNSTRQKDGTIEKVKYAVGLDTRIRDNIWKYGIGNGKSTLDKIAFEHPAIFPEKLAEDHILSWSNKGDLILDPMCGSGTTLKMAKKNNRNYIGIEISPEYCKIAEQRLKQQVLNF